YIAPYVAKRSRLPSGSRTNQDKREQVIEMRQRDRWLSVPLVSAVHRGAFPQPAGAQVRGVVQNGVGQPIEGATVELWRPMERAAIRRTGADGAFRFGEAKSAGASALYVARIGFAPLRIAIAPGATGLRLVLTEERLPLPELVVETASHVCPTEESREAVALWCAASVGHVPVEGATFLSGRYIGATGKVEIGEAGGGRSAPNPTWGYVGSAGSKQAEWRERIRAEGYAWPISASGVDGRYEAWENPQ